MEEKDIKNILMEKFKIAAEIQDNYNKLFWDRTNVFFVIISGLFAAYGLVATKILEVDKPGASTGGFALVVISLALVLVFIGVFGALLSRLWMIIHRRASLLQNHWRERSRVLENEINIGSMIFDEFRMTEDKKLASWNEKSHEDRTGQGRSDEKNKNDKQQGIRQTLDRVFLVFILVWISLSLLGVAILVRSLL